MSRKGYKDDIRIIRLALLAVVASLGGWLVFNGISNIFNLENINPLFSIFLGVGITWGLYYFGLNKLMKG